LNQLDQLLSTNLDPDSAELKTALSNAGKALSLIEGAPQTLNESQTRQLEIVGKQLWNRSRLVKKEHSKSEQEQKDVHASKKLGAKCEYRTRIIEFANLADFYVRRPKYNTFLVVQSR
jgi:hypothetical protein